MTTNQNKCIQQKNTATLSHSGWTPKVAFPSLHLQPITTMSWDNFNMLVLYASGENLAKKQKKKEKTKKVITSPVDTDNKCPSCGQQQFVDCWL